jgi:GTP-binding protein HflX
VDRRKVSERIAQLKKQLREHDKVSQTQRRSRAQSFRVALVGYTNAGKTALMNALSGSQLLEQNKLFSTLEATTRRVSLGSGRQMLLTDTVGFIRKLPHDLVVSFRSTLKEVDDADLIVHVADITSNSLGAHIQTVHEVLGEILDKQHDTLMVFNKIDALPDPSRINLMLRHHPRAAFVSAHTGEGLDDLRRIITGVLRARVVEIELDVVRGAPAAVASFCYREGRVLRQGANDAGEQRLLVSFSDADFRRFVKAHRGWFRVVGAPTTDEDT